MPKPCAHYTSINIVRHAIRALLKSQYFEFNYNIRSRRNVCGDKKRFSYSKSNQILIMAITETSFPRGGVIQKKRNESSIVSELLLNHKELILSL